MIIIIDHHTNPDGSGASCFLLVAVWCVAAAHVSATFAGVVGEFESDVGRYGWIATCPELYSRGKCIN